MLIFTTLFVFLLVAFPTTEIGRCLRKILVEAPARRLNRTTPGRIVFYAAMGVMGLILFALFEVEGLRLFGLFAPELIMWFGLFDVALFLDVFIIAVTFGATSRVQAVRSQVVRRFTQICVRISTRPTSRKRFPKASSIRTGKKEPAEPDPACPAFA